MTILNQFDSLDFFLLKSARGLVQAEYAYILQFSGELVVFYGALVLIILWLYGSYKRNNEYKKISLSIFFTILCVFVIYAIINLGIPQWRPGAMEAVEGIKPLIPHPIDNSFPSGHALFTGAFLIGLYRYFRCIWLINITIIIGIITLISRVLGGVHYPGDIIAGLIFGSIAAIYLRPIIDRCVSFIAPIFIRIASWIRL